jgi:hypothetical protein
VSTAARAVTVGRGMARVTISADYARTIQAMIASVAPTVSRELHGYLDDVETMITREYPGDNDTRFATGTSKARWAYVFTTDARLTFIEATVLNTARWLDRRGALSARFSLLEARMLRGEALTDEERTTMQVLRSQLAPQYAAKPGNRKPYALLARNAYFYRKIREIRDDYEKRIVETLSDELAALSGRYRGT